MKTYSLTALLVLICHIGLAQNWIEIKGSDSVALGTTGSITSMAVDLSGHTYAAIGHHAIRVWDGQNWSSMPAPNCTIVKLLTDKHGRLYAAGHIDSVSFPYGSSKTYVAQWMGTAWAEIDSPSHPIYALGAITDMTIDTFGNVYVAGWLGTLNSNSTFVAKWDGTNWSMLDTAHLGQYSGTGLAIIRAMTTDPTGNLYIGGVPYTPADSGKIYKWDGTAWTNVGTGHNGLTYVTPLTMTTDLNGILYVAGSIQDSAGYNYPSNNYVARWNGTWWERIGSGSNAINIVDADIYTLITDNAGNLYAGGNGLQQPVGYQNPLYHKLSKWDGTRWAEPDSGILGLNANDTIMCMAIDHSGRIYVGGAFKNVYRQNYVATWDGSQWGALSPQCSASLNASNNARSIVEDPKTGNIYTQWQGIITKWDGAKWTQIGTGNHTLSTAVYSDDNIVVDTAGRLYAVGFNGDTTGNRYGYNTLVRWDDSVWTVMGNKKQINKISIDHSNNIYAGWDTASQSNGWTINNYEVAKWNGTSWTNMPGLDGNGPVYAITTDNAGNVYAGGAFTDDSLSNRTYHGPMGFYYIAKWDGTSWTHLGHLDSITDHNGNGTPPIQTIQVDAAGNIYAHNGREDSAVVHTCYNPYNSYTDGVFYISRWDGSSWVHVGPRFQGTTTSGGTANGVIRLFKDNADNIWASARMMDSLSYACGNYGYTDITYFASWTGSRWKEYLNGFNTSFSLFPTVAPSGTAYASINYGNSNIFNLYRYQYSCNAPVQQGLCVVTIDSAANKPVVVWEKADKYATTEYTICRTASPGSLYDAIATVSRDSLSTWMDTSAHPELMSYRYKIAASDTCGLKDAMSPYHQTIYLSYLGNAQFGWTPYAVESGTNPVTTYDLYYDLAGNGNWQLITSVPNTQTTAADPNYAAHGGARYKIVATLSTPCNPTRGVTTISSNVLSGINVSTGVSEAIPGTIRVIPNPSNGYFTLYSDAGDKAITVTDMLGQIVYQGLSANESCILDVGQWPKGVYTCQIQIGSKTYRARLVRD